jgi:hypothetical protein
MSGINPTLAQEMRIWLRERRQELNMIERLVDRVEELEWENESLRNRMDIVRKAKEEAEE